MISAGVWNVLANMDRPDGRIREPHAGGRHPGKGRLASRGRLASVVPVIGRSATLDAQVGAGSPIPINPVAAAVDARPDRWVASVAGLLNTGHHNATFEHPLKV